MMSNSSSEQRWTTVIKPVTGWFDLNLRELWRSRDLVMLFVWRDFVTVYKQTILGPLWFLLQPLLTTMVFVLIFGRLAGLSTDGVPRLLFYLLGTVTWSYFANCLQKTSTTFSSNAHIFGKVYFPRLTVPLSIVISNLIAFAIQFSLFLLFFAFYASEGWIKPALQPTLLLLPVLLIQMAALGLGCGMIVASLTTRYRDLGLLVGFGVQLWMFVTPVVYPASMVPQRWEWLMGLNPMAAIINTFRHAFHGVGNFDIGQLLVSMAVTATILAMGVLLFSRIEKSFMDTI
jgi:lipopolysaccharide transport system permease protein